jgi:hypothetical protein
VKLSQVKVKVISSSDAATLETALQAFLQAGAERTFLDIAFEAVTGLFTALVTYTE